MLLGKEKLNRLSKAKVAVFGLGGVGSYALEALARNGVGSFILVDNDIVTLTNLNRQIIALHSTIGLPKTQVCRQRIKDINPGAEVEAVQKFYLNEGEVCLDGVDYVLDAIDTVTAKLNLIQECGKKNIPIISAMGCGGKLDPAKLTVTDIYSTGVCPLCAVMRKELRKRGVSSLEVVYSTEKAQKPEPEMEPELKSNGRPVVGSCCFVPGSAGLLMAAKVIEKL